MEFTFNLQKQEWDRSVLADSKAFVIKMASGNKIEIPDFIEEYKMQMNMHDMTVEEIGFEYHNGILPFVDDFNSGRRFICNMLNGKWNFDPGQTLFEPYIDLCLLLIGKDNQLLAAQLHKQTQEMKELKRDVDFLKSLFNHVREKNTMLDEWLKTLEEVATEKPADEVLRPETTAAVATPAPNTVDTIK